MATANKHEMKTYRLRSHNNSTSSLPVSTSLSVSPSLSQSPHMYNMCHFSGFKFKSGKSSRPTWSGLPWTSDALCVICDAVVWSSIGYSFAKEHKKLESVQSYAFYIGSLTLSLLMYLNVFLIRVCLSASIAVYNISIVSLSCLPYTQILFNELYSMKV